MHFLKRAPHTRSLTGSITTLFRHNKVPTTLDKTKERMAEDLLDIGTSHHHLFR
jgi:hypothetical protein